jgi:amidase
MRSRADLQGSIMFQKPTVADLREAAERLGMRPSEAYLDAVAEIITPLANAYATLDATPDELPPVKYPHREFYRPPAAENPYGAWYVKTAIKGKAGGKLAGRRVALKDNICLAGVPMMIGAQLLDGYVPEVDATVVERILDAGGEIAGKAVCEYFCEVDMAMGGDQAGSIRIPASHCGIVGLKPTFGLVPYTGIGLLEITIDTCGPMTATVADNALLLEIIAGPDGLDTRQRGVPAGRYSAALAGGIEGLRVAVVKEGFGHPNSESDVDAHVREAAQRFAKLGALVEEVSVPTHALGFPVWAAIRGDAACVMLLEMNGAGIGHEGLYVTSLIERAMGWRKRADEFADTLKIASIFSRHALDRYGGRFYAKAQNLRRRVRAGYDAVLASHDLLLLPTVPMKATPIPGKDATPQEITRRSWEPTRNTCPFNVTGHPAISLPCGMEDGRPIGLMLVGRHYAEETIYRAAAAFERSGDWTKF